MNARPTSISGRLRAIASVEVESAGRVADETIRALAGSLERLERARARLARISTIARESTSAR